VLAVVEVLEVLEGEIPEHLEHFEHPNGDVTAAGSGLIAAGASNLAGQMFVGSPGTLGSRKRLEPEIPRRTPHFGQPRSMSPVVAL
jgi:hypothetical protein